MAFGVNGPENGHKITYSKVKSQTGKTYIQPKVQIKLSEQKWVPQNINPQNFSSIEDIRKQYPGQKIHVISKEGNKTVYGRSELDSVYDEDGFITVTKNKKGTTIEIENIKGATTITSKYVNGKLVHASKGPTWADPYLVVD